MSRRRFAFLSLPERGRESRGRAPAKSSTYPRYSMNRVPAPLVFEGNSVVLRVFLHQYRADLSVLANAANACEYPLQISAFGFEYHMQTSYRPRVIPSFFTNQLSSQSCQLPVRRLVRKTGRQSVALAVIRGERIVACRPGLHVTVHTRFRPGVRV